MRREPGYAHLAVLTIAIGIAATTTLSSVTYSVLLKLLPWPESHQVMRIIASRAGQPARIADTDRGDRVTFFSAMFGDA